MAEAIVAGIEKDRLVITADVQTAALARAAGLLGPYVRYTMDRQVRRVRGSAARPELSTDVAVTVA